MPRMYPEMGHQAPLFVEAPALRKVAAAASFSLIKIKLDSHLTDKQILCIKG